MKNVIVIQTINLTISLLFLIKMSVSKKKCFWSSGRWRFIWLCLCSEFIDVQKTQTHGERKKKKKKMK